MSTELKVLRRKELMFTVDIDHLELQRAIIRDNMRKEIARQYRDGQEHMIELGHWDCPDSPIGRCFYDHMTDPGYLDQCLVCGNPDERK